MKRKLLVAAILAALSISTATAFAAPTFSGDARMLTQENSGGRTYTEMRFRLNADADLGDGFYAHGRIMGIDTKEFVAAGTGATGAAANMEQMYLGTNFGGVDFKAGRQGLLVGKGLLADINGIEGISAATTLGDFNVDGFLGRSGLDDTMAANISTRVQGVNLGAGYLKREDNKYWSVNAGTKINNVALDGQYVKNNTTDKTGFMVKATVGQVAQKGDFNYAFSYRDIEGSAIDSEWTTNGAFADSKGFRVEANYKVGNNVNLNVYKDFVDTVSAPSQHPNQARAELSVSF